MKYEDFVLERDDRDLYPRLDNVIAKYNPLKYDSRGVYTDASEWTCIEEAFRDGLIDEYAVIENAFVEFFKSVLKIKKCQWLVVYMWSGFNDVGSVSKLLDTEELFRNSEHIKNHSVVDVQTACVLLRLSLRCVLNCSLVNMAHGIEFMVGYEYYLHMRCSGIDYRILEHLSESFGLHLNPGGDVSTKDIKYDELLNWLQGASIGDMINPIVFDKGVSSSYVYNTLFFSDTILINKKPRLKAAICLSKPAMFAEVISSWDSFSPFQKEAKLLVFKFGRKVKVGEDIILIGRHPLQWKEYRTKDSTHFLYL